MSRRWRRKRRTDKDLRQTASILESSLDEVPVKTSNIINEVDFYRKQSTELRKELVAAEFDRHLKDIPKVFGVPVLATILKNADIETLRDMADKFKQHNQSSVIVLASIIETKPVLIAAISDDLVKRGLNAGELVKLVAKPLDGSGGGRATLAQAGGRDASHLIEALDQVIPWVKQKLA